MLTAIGILAVVVGSVTVDWGKKQISLTYALAGDRSGNHYPGKYISVIRRRPIHFLGKTCFLRRNIGAILKSASC